MINAVKIIIATFLTATGKDLWPKVKTWIEKDTTRLVFVFFLLLTLMVLTLFVACALFTNNIVECRKACGPKMMTSYSEDTGCSCRELLIYE